MKTRSVILSLFCCLAAFSAPAQTVIMQQDVNRDTIESNFGPNKRHYVHYYAGFGFGLPGGERKLDGKELEDIKYGFGTGQMMIGMRYKLRLFEHYALGLDLSYNRQTFNFKQRDDKFFPTFGKHEKERLIFHNLALEAYQRINFGKRGNHLGRFIDMGAYGEWNFGNSLLTIDKLDSANVYGARKIKTKQKDLNYVNPINYGLSARISNSRLALYGRYRLSNLLDKKKLDGYPDLSRLVIGLQVGL